MSDDQLLGQKIDNVSQNIATLNQNIILLWQNANQNATNLSHLLINREIAEIKADPRFADPLNLLRHGFKAYSQNDEDGIIQEIFARIGVTNRTFIEFGVGNGLENNTTYLLAQGWSGLWIEGSQAQADHIQANFAPALSRKQLTLTRAFATPTTINTLFADAGFSGEIDLLSVDIDGNDYHVLEAIEVVKPRVIVLEYNAKFRPPVSWVMPFNEHHQWDGTDRFGASLCAFDSLLNPRGYRLVGCNITGINAFFVRADLVEGKFEAPFTPEHHYQPARYYLTPGFVAGHVARHPPV